MNWIYRKTEPGLWTVGFFDSKGRWEPESDHSSSAEAAARVHYLNGGHESLTPEERNGGAEGLMNEINRMEGR